MRCIFFITLEQAPAEREIAARRSVLREDPSAVRIMVGRWVGVVFGRPRRAVGICGEV